jgi:hypothetical protein
MNLQQNDELNELVRRHIRVDNHLLEHRLSAVHTLAGLVDAMMVAARCDRRQAKLNLTALLEDV